MLMAMKKRYLIAGAYGLAGAALAVKLLLSRPRNVDWAEHAAVLHHADRSRFAEIEGVRVHYQKAGEPELPPVVLLHGFCASNLVWSNVLLPLAESGLRVIAPDLVGFGFSAKPRAGEYTIDSQARVIIGLLDHLGIERATLVGSSYGGAVAATCALDFAERVERLVLVGAVTDDEAKRQFFLRLGAAPVLGDFVTPLLLGSRHLVRRRMRKIYGEGAQVFNEQRVIAHHLPLRAANTQHAVLRTLRRWKAERIAQAAHLIKQPTLLIWGENDRDIPLRHAEYLHKVMPNSRLIVFRRCGHLPQEEYPQEFTELVADFCGTTEGCVH